MENIREYIRYKALDFKYGTRSGGARLLDHVIENVVDSDGNVVGQEVTEIKLQNVCAKLSEELVKRMENSISLLNMSKREFIELAVIQALDEIDSVLVELDVFDEEGAQ